MLVYPSLAICFLVVAAGDSNIPVASIEDYPYVASIEYENLHYGGASIISRYFVVTDFLPIWGEQVYDESLERGLLTVRTGSLYPRKGGSVHSVCGFAIEWPNDSQLAVLQLADPIEFDRTRQPIRLIGPGDRFEPGMKVRFASWYDTRYKIYPPHALRSFEAVLKEDCSKNPFPVNRTIFCIDTPVGIETGMTGVGHAVVIDDVQVALVIYSERGLTFFSDLPGYAGWITHTMANMPKHGNKCRRKEGNENVIE